MYNFFFYLNCIASENPLWGSGNKICKYVYFEIIPESSTCRYLFAQEHESQFRGIKPCLRMSLHFRGFHGKTLEQPFWKWTSLRLLLSCKEVILIMSLSVLADISSINNADINDFINSDSLLKIMSFHCLF